MYNLILWDAFANYKVIAEEVTMQECKEIEESVRNGELDIDIKGWHEFEYVKVS